MDRLWAPWRINYIRARRTKKCLFCQSQKSSSGSFVIFKTRYAIVLLNIFPYNNGHLMVSPLRHVRDIAYLKEEEVLGLIKASNRAKALLDKVLKPEGYNIGMNISAVAGAGIAGHLHIHIVPRWRGDTNFMPVVSNTKVVSQSLKELYRELKNAQKKYFE
jgi:ATP adenylyltransferase